MINIISAITEGIPLLNRLIKPFKKKLPEDLTKLTREDLVSVIEKVKSKEEESILIWAVKLILSGATVYFMIWLSKEFHITREEIINLFGLFK